jgi:hypothetical protein
MHCDIYKSSYTISQLNSPTPLFPFLPSSWNTFNMSHFSISIQEYIIFLLHSPFHTISLYTLLTGINLINFCIWCEVMVQFHYVTYSFPVVPKSFVKETILSTLNDIETLLKINFLLKSGLISNLSILIH